MGYESSVMRAPTKPVMSGQHGFEVLDHHGRKQIITGEGILLEELHCRLMPPQKIMADDDEGYFRINVK